MRSEAVAAPLRSRSSQYSVTASHTYEFIRRYMDELQNKIIVLDHIPVFGNVRDNDVKSIMDCIQLNINEAKDYIMRYNRLPLKNEERENKLANELFRIQETLQSLLALLHSVLLMGMHAQNMNIIQPTKESIDKVEKNLSGLADDGSLKHLQTQMKEVHETIHGLCDSNGTLTCIKNDIQVLHKHVLPQVLSSTRSCTVCERVVIVSVPENIF